VEQPRAVVPAGTLADKVVLITGASQGIGAAAAWGFACAGAAVALGARRADKVTELARAIESAGGTAFGMALDVTDEASVASFVSATVKELGRLDGAFNNAGIDPNPPRPVHEETLGQWTDIFAVKANGTFLSMKHEVPALLANGRGAIVNNGSAVGSRGMAMFASPCASQSAILGLTKSASAAYARSGVRVNMLATGGIATPERLAGGGGGTHTVKTDFCPMGRSGSAGEVAAVAAWLLSDYSSFVTGAVVPVDGGWLAGQ
jgi:A-factor type gamma-butyrolactone 1'-reductase (1S-forming)